MMPDSDIVDNFFLFVFYTPRAKHTEASVQIVEQVMFRLYYPPPRFSLLNVNTFIKAMLANHLSKWHKRDSMADSVDSICLVCVLDRLQGVYWGDCGFCPDLAYYKGIMSIAEPHEHCRA